MLLVLIFFIIILIIISLNIKIFIEIKDNKLSLLLKFYILKKILIGKINLNKKNIKKRKNGKNKFRKNKITKKELRKLVYIIIKKAKTRLEFLDFQIDICTTDVIATSYAVAIVSNVITFILKILKTKINYNKCSYKINPIYSNEKILNIKLNCIISANLVHIITIIFRNMKEWRCDKNGRKTSNRRSYGNCDEQHKANDRCKYYNRRSNKSTR